MKTQKGYTLTEVLIVVVIIALMASLAIPRLLSQGEKAGSAEAINMIGAIKRAQMQYFDQQGKYLAFTDVCSLTRDDLGIDFSDACPATKWTYSVDNDGVTLGQEVVTIMATGVTVTTDTIYYRLTGTDKGKWGGSGTFDCDDGPNWPNLKNKLSSC